jgi:geranylgeranyl diphosphate synthase type II
MTKSALGHPENITQYVYAINEIANAAGVNGMLAGQCMDLICESGHETGEDTLRYIQINKTAKLFIAAMRAAGRLAGADEEEMGALSLFGLKYGLLFQAADDINDAAGETGKLTSVSVFGFEGTKREVIKLHAEAVRAISPFGDKAEFFIKLARETYYSSLQGPQGLA